MYAEFGGKRSHALRVPAHEAGRRGRGRQDHRQSAPTSTTSRRAAPCRSAWSSTSPAARCRPTSSPSSSASSTTSSTASRASSTTASATSPGRASARAPFGKGFRLEHFGKVIHARIHEVFGNIVDKVQVHLTTDAGRGRRAHRGGARRLRRAQRAHRQPHRRVGRHLLQLPALPELRAQPRLRGQPRARGPVRRLQLARLQGRASRSTPPAPTSRCPRASSSTRSRASSAAPTSSSTSTPTRRSRGSPSTPSWRRR